MRFDDDLDDFVKQQIADGHYDTPSDVVDAGLKLLQKKIELEAIEAAIAEAEASGEPVEFDFEAFLERKRRERGV